MNEDLSGGSASNISWLKKAVLFSAVLLLDIIAVLAIYGLMKPVIDWYLTKRPFRGVDVYLTATYVEYLKQNLLPRFSVWKYIWYSGMPLSLDYPSFYFYLLIPITTAYGLIKGIQLTAIYSLFLFLSGCYLLYNELSRNRGLAFLLVCATFFSANLYRALVWGGGIPNWLSQTFLPIVLFLTIKHIRTGNKKYLALNILLTGIGLSGHPQNFMTTIIVAVVIFYLFSRIRAAKFFTFKKLWIITVYLSLSIIISLPETAFNMGSLVNQAMNMIKSSGKVIAGQTSARPNSNQPLDITQLNIQKWNQEQFYVIFSDTHAIIFYLVAAGVLLYAFSFIWRKQRIYSLIDLVPVLIWLLFELAYVYSYSRGIDLFQGGWYKVFWPYPVVFGTVAAFLWGSFVQSFNERDVFKSNIFQILVKVIGFLMIMLFVVSTYLLFWDKQQNLISKIEKIGRPTSLYPSALSMRMTDEERHAFAQNILPDFIDKNDKHFRLYEIDATVNIWWNTLFQVPLARGYVDPPLSPEQRWGLFWLDSVMGPGSKNEGRSSLIEDWNNPPEVVLNNARFLLDWYAVKYIEGNHSGENTSKIAGNILVPEIIDKIQTRNIDGVFQMIYFTGSADYVEKWDPNIQHELNFYQVKDELVTPIQYATNATPILLVGSDITYDTLMRFVGMYDLNSQKVVLVKGPKYIDDWELKDYRNFELVILYGYDYRSQSKAWKRINEYLNDGGKIFIDTGFEAKESDTQKLPKSFQKKLPDFFPITETVREDIGKDWQVSSTENGVAAGIEFDKFSPLVFDNEPWNISHTTSSGLNDGAEILLSLKGFPVLVKNKTGNVIWSGLNLPYHVIRDFNTFEGNLLINILKTFISLDKKAEAFYQVDWISPQERSIKTQGARGVILKEMGFPGWQANVDYGSKSSQPRIYNVGPSTPQFMYVRLDQDKKAVVVFKYRGNMWGIIFTALSVVVIIALIDTLVFNQRIFAGQLVNFGKRLAKPVSKWWEKDETENY